MVGNKSVIVNKEWSKLQNDHLMNNFVECCLYSEDGVVDLFDYTENLIVGVCLVVEVRLC